MTSKRRHNAKCHICNAEGICSRCGAPIPDASSFSDWIREQKRLESKIGFVTTNIDFLWRNYKTGQWMFIEEKQYMADVNYPQRKSFQMIHSKVKNDFDYCGFHLVQFEKRSPEDGKIYLNRKLITKERLLDFLAFDMKAKGLYP